LLLQSASTAQELLTGGMQTSALLLQAPDAHVADWFDVVQGPWPFCKH
jgi:ABC-type uncharacterized transport system permease subunit